MPDIKKKKHVIYDLSVILSLQIYICSTFVCALFVGEEKKIDLISLLLLLQVLTAVAAANVSRTAANEWAALLLGPGPPPLGGGGPCDTAFVFCALSQITPIQLTGLNLYDVQNSAALLRLFAHRRVSEPPGYAS